MIDDGLQSTSVTVVLIDAETAFREWVKYEIQKSCGVGNGIVGVYIHNILDRCQNRDAQGPNPMDAFALRGQRLSRYHKSYDSVVQDGYQNLGTWIEEAARAVGR